MPIDIENFEGTIQSRGAKIKRIRKLYSKKDEEQIYQRAVELLNRRFPKFVKPEDITAMKKKGRIFLADYSESATHRGECYGQTLDVSTKFPLVNGELDVTLLHELVHKITFAKGIITEKDFEKNAPFYEGATELVSQKVFGFRRESTAVSGFKVNLGGDVAYTSQVALLQQLDLILGGEFVEQSILSDKDALKNEMIAQFGKDNYEFIWNRMADTMNATNSVGSISAAIDDIQKVIIENCLPMKLKSLKTQEEFENFFKMVQEVGDIRLSTDKNLEEFQKQYGKYISYAEKAAEAQGIDTSFLDKYRKYEYERLYETEPEYLAALAGRTNFGRIQEDLFFENANNVKMFFMKENLEERIPENVEVFADFSKDVPMIVMLRDGELLAVTRKERGNYSTNEYVALNPESYGSYLGRVKESDEVAKRILGTEKIEKAFKAYRPASEYSLSGAQPAIEDYFVVDGDEMKASISSRSSRETRTLRKIDGERKEKLFDAIRSSIELPKYFRKQKKILEKETGQTFYREGR